MEKGQLNGIIGNVLLEIIPIKITGNKSAPVVNMFFPTIGQVAGKQWEQILDAVRDIKYQSSLFGTGTYGRGFRCIGCHGMDHPAGMCPYRNLDGWHEICGINSDTLDAYRNRIFKDLPTKRTPTTNPAERPSAQAKYATDDRNDQNTPGKTRGVWKGRGRGGRGGKRGGY